MKSILATRASVLGAGVLMASLLVASMPYIASADSLSRQLEIGMSGSDVTSLQTFLALDPTIYPQGLVTGYFGPLTQAAVANFQSRNGLAAVGRVGPLTLPIINAQMSGAVGVDVNAPIISGVNLGIGSNNATVSFNTSEPAKSVVYYGTSPLSEYESLHSVVISGAVAMTDTQLRSPHSINIGGLTPNTTYYYDVYVTDAAGNNSMTMQATFHTGN